MQWINSVLEQAPPKNAPPNGYRRKEECFSFLIMLDLQVVSVENNPNYLEFSVIRASHFHISRVIVFE